MNSGVRILNPEGQRRTSARSFQELVVWQKAHLFVLKVYHLTEGFPVKEVDGLGAQLRRAAVSIPANIAEGFKKRGRLDKVRFLNNAQGSLEECRYYLVLTDDLKYGDVGRYRSSLKKSANCWRHAHRRFGLLAPDS